VIERIILWIFGLLLLSLGILVAGIVVLTMWLPLLIAAAGVAVGFSGLVVIKQAR
jgi:quinol-cytochrome oxidoreductase complex cytochrome b subunit